MVILNNRTKLRMPRPTRVGSSAVALLPLSVLVPIALMGPNTILALYACAALAIGTFLLWRPQEPSILLFLFLYQWVQATISTFHGNLLGRPVAWFTVHSGRHEEAILLIITGLIILCVGMRIGAGRTRADLPSLLKGMVGAYPASKWVTLYVIVWLFSFVCGRIAPISGGLDQIFLVLAEIKWAAFLLLTVSSLGVEKRPKAPWLIAVVLELLLAVGGFFADFSSVFYFALIGILFAKGDIRGFNKILGLIVIIVMLIFAVAWTEVKQDYRNFINKGASEQVVLVGYEDRMGALIDRIAALDAKDMANGADKLARRLSYFEFFGVVLERNAAGQPHSKGEIWGAGALSPLMPRAIFPNKAIVNDTDLTSKYTGLNSSGWSAGTSISLGYMAEAFIDFGHYLMFVAIGSLGLLIGRIHRWLLSQKGGKILVGAAFVPVALMPAHLLEISAIKLLPALILSVLAGWIVLRFLAPIAFRWAGIIRSKTPAVPLAYRTG